MFTSSVISGFPLRFVWPLPTPYGNLWLVLELLDVSLCSSKWKIKTTSLKRLKCCIELSRIVKLMMILCWFCHRELSHFIIWPNAGVKILITAASSTCCRVTSDMCASFKTLTSFDLDVLWVYDILSATCGSDWRHTVACLLASTDGAL